MGSVGLGNGAAVGAFLNRLHVEGLDLGRCQIKEALGIYVADPASTFRAGMLVMRNAAGLVVASDGSDVLGVAKWNHTNSLLAVAVDEAVVLSGTSSVALKHGNVSNVRVASAAAGGGSVYAETTDYTVAAANGTIARVGAGGITNGATVYVTYTYALTTAMLTQTQGTNFWNGLDEVSTNEGRITVITDSELLFTSQYDTAAVYALSGANSNLYACDAAGKEGLFTTDPSSGKFVGRVFQVPTAADPFLGLRLIKNPVAA